MPTTVDTASDPACPGSIVSMTIAATSWPAIIASESSSVPVMCTSTAAAAMKTQPIAPPR